MKTVLLTTAVLFSVCSFGQQKTVPSFRWATCPDCPLPEVAPARLKEVALVFGYLTVPENRARDNGRKLRLAVAVLKSRKPNPSLPPLVILHGGPGGHVVGRISWQYEELRQERDLVFIDQRGSGYSEPDFSPEMNQEIMNVLSANYSPAQEMQARTAIAAQAKAAVVKKGIDLSAYNSHAIAADVNDLCRLLGFKTWDLWGTSYGSRIALTMMRDFPEGIRSVVLESPIPPNARYFENMTVHFAQALNKLFDKCAADPACQQAYPDLRKQFYEAISSLDKNPLVLEMNDRSKFPDGKFVINAQDMLLGFQQALYGKEVYPILPLLIGQVKKRNKVVMQSFAQSMSDGMFRIDYGLYYSVICSECIPFNNVKKFEETSANFWDGISFYKDEFSICKTWYPAAPDSLEGVAVSSNIPTLILSGEMDPMASPAMAALTGQTLPNAYVYTFQNVGHFVTGERHAVDLLGKFLADPGRNPDDKRYVSSVKIPFVTDVHVHNGIVRMAPKLQLNANDLAYKVWIIILVVLLVTALVYLLRRLIRGKREQAGMFAERGLIVSGILSAGLSLVFIGGLGWAIYKTVQVNYFLLGFGLPAAYALILLLPYLIFGLLILQILLLLRSGNKRNTKNAPLYSLLMQVPFIVFILYFNLFYS